MLSAGGGGVTEAKDPKYPSRGLPVCERTNIRVAKANLGFWTKQQSNVVMARHRDTGGWLHVRFDLTIAKGTPQQSVTAARNLQNEELGPQAMNRQVWKVRQLLADGAENFLDLRQWVVNHAHNQSIKTQDPLSRGMRWSTTSTPIPSRKWWSCCLTRRYRGYSKVRIRTAPRKVLCSKAQTYRRVLRRCVSLISSYPCKLSWSHQP